MSYELLSVIEAAARLGRKRWWIYVQIKKRKLPYYQIGGGIKISQRDLDDYVARSRVPALGERKKRKEPKGALHESGRK